MLHNETRNIYIGRLIQQKVDERHMSYAEFARQIHCGRTNVYKIFSSKSIDMERLLRICDVLEYDFIHEVYIPSSVPTHQAFPALTLPFRNGRVSVEGLSEQIRTQLREQL